VEACGLGQDLLLFRQADDDAVGRRLRRGPVQVDYIADTFGGEIFHHFRQIQRGRSRRAGARATGSKGDQELGCNCR